MFFKVQIWTYYFPDYNSTRVSIANLFHMAYKALEDLVSDPVSIVNFYYLPFTLHAPAVKNII